MIGKCKHFFKCEKSIEYVNINRTTLSSFLVIICRFRCRTYSLILLWPPIQQDLNLIFSPENLLVLILGMQQNVEGHQKTMDLLGT